MAIITLGTNSINLICNQQRQQQQQQPTRFASLQSCNIDAALAAEKSCTATHHRVVIQTQNLSQ
jgi:hypothetical protein